MERKISLASLQKAVDDAFEAYKSIKEGNVDERVAGADPKAYGISVVLTDGTVIEKGDTKALSPLGRIALLPTHVLVLTQNSPEELVRKAGIACCNRHKENKPKGLPVSPHGVRAVSVVEPSGDSDGKYDVMVDNIIDMAASAPVLDDRLYEAMMAENAKADVINAFEVAQYGLYDSAAIAVDLYTRLAALQMTTTQLATMGATVAADGVNPSNNQPVFDGSIAANVVATLARGVHKEGRAWMMTVGLPAASSFGGAIVAVLPGFGAIAAYSPELDANGVSVKAAKAIRYIANTLGLNVFASARVKVEK